MEQFKKAVELQPDLHLAWVNLGETYRLQHKLEEAINAYNKFLSMVPEDGTVLVRLAQSYMALADYARTLEVCEQALDLGVEKAEIYYNLGFIREQEGSFVEARHHYERALQMDSNHAEACYRLGAVMESLGNDSQALRLYQQSLDLDPAYAAASHGTARLLLKKGNAEEGRQWMQLFQRLKQYEEKVKARKRVLQRNPRDVEAAYELGEVYLEHRRYQKARSVFQKILQLEPDFSAARKRLDQLDEKIR